MVVHRSERQHTEITEKYTKKNFHREIISGSVKRKFLEIGSVLIRKSPGRPYKSVVATDILKMIDKEDELVNHIMLSDEFYFYIAFINGRKTF